jgi:trans-AT polyketide synthase/acyltransferase/oxidoreductase domain-containing protein
MTTSETYRSPGWWMGDAAVLHTGDRAIRDALLRVSRPVYLVDSDGQPAVAQEGAIRIGSQKPLGAGVYPLRAYVPPLHPQDLGDPFFRRSLNLRFAYIAGAMANGITSVEMVAEAGRNGMLGFFGAAGLLPEELETAVTNLQQRLKDKPFGSNLIHNPYNPELEAAVVNLYLRRGVRLVSASAFLDLTLPLVYYRVKGLMRGASGRVECRNKVIAKVSRVEVARKFLSPPPQKLLSQLIDRRLITADEASLAGSIPMADHLTAEADSGGHTDNRPALTLLPTMLALRDEMIETYRYPQPICVGLAGGIANPASTSAAFAMGAAYVLTGTINQACVEAATSATVRQMLAEADQADVIMAPSADMFELGVKVQVLKRGTMFPLRAAKLYELYTTYDRYEDIPIKQREVLERDFFRKSFEGEWEQTKQFFSRREPHQISKAEQDPKHKMALVFRSYLGQSSKWAKTGDPQRRIDYQIWCGPAIGAFNRWVKGSCLENPEQRRTVTVAMNLLFGAAFETRTNWLRCQGVQTANRAGQFTPLPLSELWQYLEEPSDDTASSIASGGTVE